MNWTKDLTESKILFLVGPTAVGKTALALELAEGLRAEIISADSRQVYRLMDIGTAKPSRDDLRRVKHHFIDIRDPDQYYSAGEYGREARECIASLIRQEIMPIVVGGSGFYIQALADGLFAPAISDLAIKEKWRQKIASEGKEAVFAELQKVDPATAARLHMNDTQRVVRALEVFELAGEPISSFRSLKSPVSDFQPVFIGLDLERSKLNQRIDARVDAMFECGLVDEVRSLLRCGYSPDLNALQTVGYKELFNYLNSHSSYEDMVELVKRNTRHYAKRQMTWFRRDSRIEWLDVQDPLAMNKILEIAEKWDTDNNG
jgi:tRNA dimethylallyltransferase